MQSWVQNGASELMNANRWLRFHTRRISCSRGKVPRHRLKHIVEQAASFTKRNWGNNRKRTGAEEKKKGEGSDNGFLTEGEFTRGDHEVNRYTPLYIGPWRGDQKGLPSKREKGLSEKTCGKNTQKKIVHGRGNHQDSQQQRGNVRP